MGKPEKWLKTIEEYWTSGGDGYYCWCMMKGAGPKFSCYLYRLAIEFESRTARIEMEFVPEVVDLPRENLIDGGKYKLELFPALTLFPRGLSDRELIKEIEAETKAATGKFFRLRGLEPFPETLKLIRAIAARVWYLAKKAE